MTVLSSRAVDLAHSTLIGAALEASEHAVLVSETATGVIVAVNDAACELLWRTRADLLTCRAAGLRAESADELAALDDQLRQTGSVRRTLRFRRPDGSAVELGATATLVGIGGVAHTFLITATIGRARTGTITAEAVERREDARALQAQASLTRARSRRLRETALARRKGHVVDALELRRERAWQALEDAIEELAAVHDVGTSLILGRVMQAIAVARVPE